MGGKANLKRELEDLKNLNGYKAAVGREGEKMVNMGENQQ